jgi:hypothetical protein
MISYPENPVLMRLTATLFIAALVVPSVSEAQRRFQVPEGVPISHKDVERLSPAGVVLSRREPLKLEKPQIAKLDSLRRAFEDTAKRVADNVKQYQRAINTAPPLLKRPPEGKPETRKDSLERAKLDSTNRLKRDKYFETVTTGRRDLAGALLALKDLFDASLAATIQALDGAQHTTAALTLEQTSEEFTRRLRLANVR